VDEVGGTRIGEGRAVYWFWLGSPKERDHWEDLGVGGRITLKDGL